MEDPYTEPATGLLRNRLGITDRAALTAAESDISFAVIMRLLARPLPGSYDLRHLQAFHRESFDSVYPWAGEIRTVAIAKTDLFCLPQHIRPYADGVFADLAAEKHLRDLPREEFVPRWVPEFFTEGAPHDLKEAMSAVVSEVHPLGFRLMAKSSADTDTTDLLPNIGVPTLVLWGEQWMIQDLDSTNGTWHDGKRVASPVPVTIGAPIKVGATTFELRK